MISNPILSVENLDLRYRVRGEERAVLRNLSFEIGRGESYALVGESGCGKSSAAMAIVRYLARNAVVSGGSITLNGDDMLHISESRLRTVRARVVSMVYQEPGRALNPSMRIGDQVAEVYKLLGRTTSDAWEASITMLARMQISGAERVMESYPHMLSGGMQQRIVIAMALATDPALLILDEPTTALDSTVGAEVMDIVSTLRAELGTSVLLISHNLALVAQMCDRVGVMYAGRIVEEGPTAALFANPEHPYTASLLNCIPGTSHDKRTSRLATIPGAMAAPGTAPVGCHYADRCPLVTDECRTIDPPAFVKTAPKGMASGEPAAGETPSRFSRCFHTQKVPNMVGIAETGMSPNAVDYSEPPYLQLKNLTKTYGSGNGEFRALNDVTLSLWHGETLGIVGESGSGKTTLGRVIMGLTSADSGASMSMGAEPLNAGGGKRDLQQLKDMQIVFQNPDSALNRRHSIARILRRSIVKLEGTRGPILKERVKNLAADFTLSERFLGVRPKQLSGGLKQRVAIARAFAGRPHVVVCDEPTSALDVSVQASILNILVDKQFSTDVAYLFISHDLAVVQYISDRIAVMYLGQLMEIGPTASLMNGGHHPYTEVLLSAVPAIGGIQRERVKLQGDPPDARKPPTGCPFQSRCPQKIGAICEDEKPALRKLADGHYVACHLPDDELPQLLPLTVKETAR